jgi:hypothetical protein
MALLSRLGKIVGWLRAGNPGNDPWHGNIPCSHCAAAS